MDLDKAGFFAKTKSLTKDEMHEKLMQLFTLAEFAERELAGDWNWELAKADAGLPSEAS